MGCVMHCALTGNSYNMLGQELKSKQPRQSLVVFAGTDAEGVLNISDKESWNIKGLKTEVSRQIMRQFKKVTKGDERIKRVIKTFSSPVVGGVNACSYQIDAGHLLLRIEVFLRHREQ